MDLREIPLFASLSDEGLQALRQRLRTRRYAEGEVILRAGDPARELHVILEGAARVELGGGAGGVGTRAILASAGQTVGEMSLLSASPVSATVIAQREVVTLALTAEDLSRLLESEPSLYRAISALVIERLRHRTGARGAQLQPGIAALFVDAAAAAVGVAGCLARGIAHYSPGSERIDGASIDLSALAARIERWREQAAGDQYLIIAAPPERFAALQRLLRPGDAALRLTANPGIDAGAAGAGPAHLRTVLCGAPPMLHAPGPWVDTVAADEVDACRAEGRQWNRTRYPRLDRLARFVTHREIGVALSVGAAGGFAHLGFLEVLEQSGVPIDFVCGASMGGAVALSFGQHGTAAAAADAICRLGGDFARSRGLQVLPRSGLVSTRRMQEISRELFGDATFADLALPVSAVAADLVSGDRVVLDRGPIEVAARATVAIPGLLPPVRVGNRILVDGGLVSRVPADLLVHRRCGLRLAAAIVPLMADSPAQRDEEAHRLQRQLERPFGFRSALGASWKLLGSWDSAAQAQKAEIAIRIGVDARDGFDFASGRRLIEVGRQAALAHAASIGTALAKLLTPGTP